MVNVLNHQSGNFFIAFLPQFVSYETPVSNVAILGVSFVVGGTVWSLVVAYFASSLAAIIGQSNEVKSWFNRLSGALYISLGLNVLRAEA